MGRGARLAAVLALLSATPAWATRFPAPLAAAPVVDPDSVMDGPTIADPGPSAKAAFRKADAAVRRGLRTQAYPGAVLLVGSHDRVQYARGYGHLTWRASSGTPSPSRSLWDVASLTKVVATTGVAARLVERGALDLDAPVQRYLPQFAGPGKERVTVRMLLDHTSGLKPGIRFGAAPTRDSAWALLWAEPLQRTPGTSPVYSDLNAILLGRVLETVTGLRLDEAVQREVAEPLGLTMTRYLPPESLWTRTVPTGRDGGEPVVGIVNDRNAELLGGVTGHAGLFATGTDLAKVAQAWLAAAMGRDSSWLHPATVQRFLARTPESGSRYLGWDGRDPPGTATAAPAARPRRQTPTERAAAKVSIFGAVAGPGIFGHTGWTGTFMWMDPDTDRFVVFLTNRSYDPRRKDSFAALKLARAAVSDAVALPPPAMAAAPCRVERPVVC